MKEKILQILSEIEEVQQVKILYACEAGSRAWGLASEESDYDVRFLYVHPVDWYISIDQKRDVIDAPMGENLDIVGWDLKKALFLLKKSNPPLLEWLQSRTTYYEHPAISDLKALAQTTFSAKACLFHYLNMAKRNAKGSFQSQEIKVKLLLNVVKPLLACRWIANHHSMPPNEMELLLDDMVTDPQLNKELDQLLLEKQRGTQVIDIKQVGKIQQYIFDGIKHLDNFAQTIEYDKGLYQGELDAYFLRTLKQVWGNDW
ncbi:DNA polymerase beta superfamily protein [Alkalihalobacterium alkalinitrilicum]|uniref:nucleotidyltransferase domain-containing protein n=1 Tax=Alkalihalobacterium alkalinitrilicum TaxID=427920 RepID=UPI000AB5821E|nr:nucleotidyltransferase domain-containing protein [Alkalihalobacterium alkalinitrilicum]